MLYSEREISDGYDSKFEEEKEDMKELGSGNEFHELETVISCDKISKGTCVICHVEFSNKVVSRCLHPALST